MFKAMVFITSSNKYTHVLTENKRSTKSKRRFALSQSIVLSDAQRRLFYGFNSSQNVNSNDNQSKLCSIVIRNRLTVQPNRLSAVCARDLRLTRVVRQTKHVQRLCASHVKKKMHVVICSVTISFSQFVM